MSDETEIIEESTPVTQMPTLEEQLAEAKASAAANLEGWQRTLAEFANARKRMEKQRTEAYTNATTDTLSKLLPIIDDFDRAIANVPSGIAGDGWFEGIRLVQKKLNGLLENANIERITTVGQPFDPNIHEAILQEPSDTHESGNIIRELQSGYKIGDRIIRPALVVVAA
ncbi:MAG: nucleotide exchange factor GrpE [Chloroflexi bacterium]|nr:nucleotide exchange factor GrpE [Chloroflexota bacterium]MBP8055912.1 nucleotide exchange factor GrpE [Chloroflexota bacterium]